MSTPVPENETLTLTLTPTPTPSIDAEAEAEAEGVSSDQAEAEVDEREKKEEEEEEEGECGFCLFMKGGGCREAFIGWEKCVEEAEKNKEDLVEKCAEVTGLLKKCMEANYDYYEPILRAEKVAEQQAIHELEKEAAATANNNNSARDSVRSN